MFQWCYINTPIQKQLTFTKCGGVLSGRRTLLTSTVGFKLLDRLSAEPSASSPACARAPLYTISARPPAAAMLWIEVWDDWRGGDTSDSNSSRIGPRRE